MQQGYNNVQVTYKNVARPSQKQVDKLNYKTMTTGKLLQTEPNESTCVQLHASDIKLVSSENSWHQIQNNEMNITWTDITENEDSKTVSTDKNLQTC